MPRVITAARADKLARAFPIEVFKEIEKAQREPYFRAGGSAKTGQKYFPYIQWSLEPFIQMVIPHITSRTKFVDIGCGAGDKLAAVHFLTKCKRITGIELIESNVEHARRLCPFANIIHGNALDLSYEKYDVLYAYRPIADSKLWAELVETITNTMKPGAVFLCALACSDAKVAWDAKFGDFPSKFVKPLK